ncbi:virginiamycin B lyase family protein [Nocardioides nanhaiensis]|uniref:SMP-30/Gluconolactonase/LRE-like region domain-containing protein n=1 Tax=Nocardioides nanhaiensis TaxID=1476871 RepID=A0ABP8W643_9ACTN
MRSTLLALATIATLGLAGLPALAVAEGSSTTPAAPGAAPERRLTARAAASITTTTTTVAPRVARATGARIFPVDGSEAGLGDIEAHPDGSVWFTLEDTNQVRRMTASGQLTTVTFPASSPGVTTVADLDVAPDGTVWVLYESGRMIGQLDAAGNGITSGTIGTFGQQVRVARDGVVWVTKSFDYDTVVRITGNTIYEDPNAPGCDDALGQGRDGFMWCRQDQGLVRIAKNGASGVRYPANRFAAYPYAIADGGPAGSVWFGRYFGGTIFTSPDDGEVGYLDARNGRIRTFNTGERTAPADLVAGPGGEMWFASIGAAAGIGHVTKAGRGALTRIGGYEPEHLTITRDGAVWATDPENNVVIRVPRSGLRTTNVDPGKGSVLRTPLAGKVATGTRPLVVRKSRVGVPLTCPRSAAAGCRGTARIVTGKGRALTRTARYAVKKGRKGAVRLAFTGKGLRAVPRRGTAKVTVALTPQGARRATVTKVVRVRR